MTESPGSPGTAEEPAGPVPGVSTPDTDASLLNRLVESSTEEPVEHVAEGHGVETSVSTPEVPRSTEYAPPVPGSVPVPAFAALGSSHQPDPAAQATQPRLTRRAARARAAANRDDEKVRQAARSVGLAVALASGAVVLVGCLILIGVAMAAAVHLPPEVSGTYGPGGRIIVRPDTPWGWVNARHLVWSVLGFAVLSLILTSLVGWFMARRAVKPLAEALRLQRHFVADASHELRTPLTALSSRVQILQRRLDNGKPIDEVVRLLQGDTANMTRVLDDMLLTAEGTQVIQNAKASLMEALRQSVTSLEPLAQTTGVTVRFKAADLTVAAPLTSLTRAIVAVVDNAIQHSPAGGTVDVVTAVEGRMAVVRVSDQGSGIAGVDPQRVFERFAHGSESGRKRSFGLGLALASEVAHNCGGDIRVDSTSSQGTTFSLHFPLAG